MSKHIPLIPQTEGQLFSSFYCVSNAVLRKAANGKIFTDVTISDKTGTVIAKYWDSWEDTGFGIGKIVNLTLSTEKYNGNITYKIIDIDDEKIGDESEVVPIVENLDAMKLSIQSEIAAIGSGFIKGMLERLYTDAVMESAAGLEGPFALKGGLSRCALNVCCDAVSVATMHGGLDLDIIRAGALLSCYGYSKTTPIHDFFPVEAPAAILLGSSTMGLSDVLAYWHATQPWKAEDKTREDEARVRLAQVSHVLAACAGTVIPATPEAIVIKSIYTLVFELENAKDFISRSPSTGSITGFDPVMRRKFFSHK